MLKLLESPQRSLVGSNKVMLASLPPQLMLLQEALEELEAPPEAPEAQPNQDRKVLQGLVELDNRQMIWGCTTSQTHKLHVMMGQ